MMENGNTTHRQVRDAIQALGLHGSAICLHSSLSSFGHLEGGAEALVQAFLSQGCTLVVPTFTYDCQVSTPVERQIRRNGTDYARVIEHSEAYDRDSPMISPSMGAVPATILSLPARVRGIHPLNSFAAIGPLAEAIIARQSHLDVYGPLKVLYDHPPAHIALIGVDLTKATPIHFAEQTAGRRLFRQWALELDGTTTEVAVGSCSHGFNSLAPAVEQIERSITVGRSTWRTYPFRGFIDHVAAAIASDPAITHCGNPDCLECRDAVLGGPLLGSHSQELVGERQHLLLPPS